MVWPLWLRQLPHRVFVRNVILTRKANRLQAGSYGLFYISDLDTLAIVNAGAVHSGLEEKLVPGIVAGSRKIGVVLYGLYDTVCHTNKGLRHLSFCLFHIQLVFDFHSANI